jgi:hypothetical protein
MQYHYLGRGLYNSRNYWEGRSTINTPNKKIVKINSRNKRNRKNQHNTQNLPNTTPHNPHKTDIIEELYSTLSGKTFSPFVSDTFSTPLKDSEVETFLSG